MTSPLDECRAGLLIGRSTDRWTIRQWGADRRRSWVQRESFSLSLCLHFSLALSSLSLPDFPLVHPHNPSSWTASSLRLILMQSTSVCAHKHTYRWHVVATARNSVCSDPDRLKHKTLYLKRISGVYSYTCQPIRGVRTDTYTCFYSVLLY